MSLLPQQQEAFERLRRLKVGALFMEPGTGKTRAAHALIRSVEEVDYILWLTPFQTKENLWNEIVKCGGFDVELDIIGIETLSSSQRTYLNLYQKLEQHAGRTFIVCDETLKIKNWDAKRTHRIIELSKMSTYKLILNGTPISRNLLDVWAQMEFLSPLILNMRSAEYKNTFCEWTKIKKRIGRTWYQKEYISKFHNVEHLFSLIRPYVYECDLNLEIGKQHIDLPFAIEQEVKDEYYRLKEKYLDNEKLQFLNNNIFLELTQKMQHLYSCAEEKFEAVDTLLKEVDKSKVIIFRKYLDSERELKKRFPDVRILSLQKEAFGLNLQDYHIIILWDKVWDYALIDQMEHRIYRTGQTQDCIFYNLTGDVNLERMMDENMAKKGDLLRSFKVTGNNAVKEAVKSL